MFTWPGFILGFFLDLCWLTKKKQNKQFTGKHLLSFKGILRRSVQVEQVIGIFNPSSAASNQYRQLAWDQQIISTEGYNFFQFFCSDEPKCWLVTSKFFKYTSLQHLVCVNSNRKILQKHETMFKNQLYTGKYTNLDSSVFPCVYIYLSLYVNVWPNMD